MTHKQRCKRLWALEEAGVLGFERSWQGEGRRLYVVRVHGVDHTLSAQTLDAFLDGVEAATMKATA